MPQHRWWITTRLVVLLSLLTSLGTGCVPVLSLHVRQEADRSLTLTQLRLAPQVYIDRTVIMGGDILRTWRVDTESWLEVLQKPLDSADRPLLTDDSEGRFIVRCDIFLDPAMYAVGRSITVAGRMLGTQTDKVGEYDYVYPVLFCREIYLWPPVVPLAIYPSVQLWWEWDPWYADPWYWGHYHRPSRGRHFHPHRHHHRHPPHHHHRRR